MARKIRCKKRAKIYAQRKAIVEPVKGQIKEARGPWRLLLRRLEKVNGELHLIAATHNPLKLFRFRRSQHKIAGGRIGMKGSRPGQISQGGLRPMKGHGLQNPRILHPGIRSPQRGDSTWPDGPRCPIGNKLLG
jgi:hypothetical protein